MRILKILVIASALLSGCATIGRSPALSSLPGISYDEQPSGSFAIKEIVFETPGSNVDKDRLGMCLADNLHVSDVRLSDASASFYGAYSKNYYNIERSSIASGEPTLQYLAADGTGAVARGQVAYTFNTTGGLISVPIDYVVRFTLKYERTPQNDIFRFHRLEAAQLNTGSLQNTGFGPLYDLEPLYPEKAYFELQKLANHLSNCLSGN